MNHKDIPLVLREALCLHEVFRKMGFQSEDIYALVARAADPTRCLLHSVTKRGDVCVHVVLRAQGLEYTGAIGPVPGDPELFEGLWDEAVKWWNTSPSSEIQSVWDSSRVRAVIPTVLLAMQAKGFRISHTYIGDA